jgi:uncharacterized protein (DUF58 family)
MRASLEKFRQAWSTRFLRTTRADAKGRAQIKPRSIYILPSKQGIVLVVLLLMMLVGSINYGSNLAYLVTFLLGAVWLVSMLHTWRNLLGLRLSPQPSKPVFAGQAAGFQLTLENPNGQQRFGIAVSAPGGNTCAIDLPARESRPILITLPTHQRGQLIIPKVSIHSVYPFGLFKAWTYARLDLRCLVYPQPAARGEPPGLADYARNERGDKGVGADDFVGLRTFRDGDSPRQVDWKAWARERGLHSKQFGGDRSETLSLDWDLLTDPDPEIRLRQLCRFVLLAARRQQAFSLKLPGKVIPVGLDEAHKHRCLAALAKFC